MAIRVISSDERQSRRPQMSVAQRVTRRFRSAARRARRHVPGTARRYANGAGARNAARVTFDTGCCSLATLCARLRSPRLESKTPVPLTGKVIRYSGTVHQVRQVRRVILKHKL